MNVLTEYNLIKKLDSIGVVTGGTYPSFKEYKAARFEGRVVTNFEKNQATICSSDGNAAYIFVKRRPS